MYICGCGCLCSCFGIANDNFFKFKGFDLPHYALNLLIKIAGKNKDLLRAFSVLEIIKEQSMSPDIFIYNALMSACATNHNLQKAQDVYNMMREQNVEPNVYTISALISAFANSPEATSERYISLLGCERGKTYKLIVNYIYIKHLF